VAIGRPGPRRPRAIIVYALDLVPRRIGMISGLSSAFLPLIGLLTAFLPNIGVNSTPPRH